MSDSEDGRRVRCFGDRVGFLVWCRSDLTTVTRAPNKLEDSVGRKQRQAEYSSRA